MAVVAVDVGLVICVSNVFFLKPSYYSLFVLKGHSTKITEQTTAAKTQIKALFCVSRTAFLVRHFAV